MSGTYTLCVARVVLLARNALVQARVDPQAGADPSPSVSSSDLAAAVVMEFWHRQVRHAGFVDEVLSQAMAPVLRDLRSAGIATPRVEDRDWTGDPGSSPVMLWSPDGSGLVCMSRVRRRRPTGPHSMQAIAMIADQVQEWAIEELWGEAPTTWPPCPRHPSSHPVSQLANRQPLVSQVPPDLHEQLHPRPRHSRPLRRRQ